VIQKKAETMPSSNNIRMPSQAPTFHASWIPKATPTGVLTSSMGLAIRMAQCSQFAPQEGRR
jgi:hypothetical protein